MMLLYHHLYASDFFVLHELEKLFLFLEEKVATGDFWTKTAEKFEGVFEKSEEILPMLSIGSILTRPDYFFAS